MTIELHIGSAVLNFDDDEPFDEMGKRVGAAVAEALVKEPFLGCHGYVYDDNTMHEYARELGLHGNEVHDFEWGYGPAFTDVCDRRWGGP